MAVTGQDEATPHCRSSPGTPIRNSHPFSSSPHRSAVTATGNGALLLVDAERAVAFQEARRKFAMYGKQNAHVSHLASGRKVASPARGGSTVIAGKPMRKRAMLMASTVASGEDDATVLKNTLLLQENGELALHLDDLNYHLDGVFANCGLDTDANSKSTSEQLFAGAQNVVELARLLQLEQVQLVLKLASPSQNLYARICKVMRLLLLSTSSGGDREREDLLRLAVAVMTLFLTQSADADEFFTSDSLDLIVQSLEKSGSDGRAVAERDKMRQIAEGRAPAVALKTDQLMPLKKTCLKRKAGPLKRARSSSISSGDDTGEQQLSDAASDSHDDQLFAKIKDMLESQEVFCVEGQLLQKVSTADVLVVVLHNLLQMDKRQEQQHTQTGRSYYHRDQRDLAGATFSVVLARKRQLIGNQGLDALTQSLVKRFQHLKTSFLRADASPFATTSPAFQHACSLRRVQAVLRVLDQASFLATEVQQYLTSKAVLFEILLESIDELSELCWGSRQASTWSSSSDSAWLHHLVAEVFLVSMRVLINLTHHNKDATRQIHRLHGTTVLFRAFCKLWGFVVEASKRSTSDGEAGEAGMTVVFEEKLLFDALLMCLSALTNCVEFSEENRESLSSLPAPSDGISGLQAFKTADTCELLTHFFLSKVQSYLRLIEMSESQSGSSQVATIESEGSHQWVPEDVVLGGCTSLLLGCLMKDSVLASSAVLAMLPDGSPRLLLRALSAFVALHSQIGALTPEVGDSVLQVEQTLKSFLSEQETGYSATSTAPSTPLQTVKITISVESVDRSRGGHQQSSQDADSQPRIEDEALSRNEENEVTTPPAAAFKLQRWKKVCASVDSDSESGDGDVARTQKEAPALLARSPKKLKSQSPGVRSPNVKRLKKEKASRKSPSTRSPAAALLASSATRPTRRDGVSQVQVSPQRLKRTRELVSELAAKLSKVSDDTPSFSAFSAVVTSTVDSSKQQQHNDDDDWDLDFSKDNQPPLKKKTGRATPPIRILSRDSSPMTPGARKRARIGKIPYRSPNRPKLTVALTAISLPQQVTLEDASKMPERVSSTTEVSVERESSLEIALKRKQKAAKPLPSTTTTEAAAVFDFLD